MRGFLVFPLQVAYNLSSTPFDCLEEERSMIKLIREGSKKYPWILNTIMAVIAVTFTVGMGWWGFEASQPNAVATVGPFKVSREEFARAYDNAYRFYKDTLKQEDVDEESLRQLILNSLIDSKTWILTAQEFDVVISPEDLRQSIMDQEVFQKDGTFDPQYYQRLLTANRLTPHQYEAQLSSDLIVEKARLLVQDATALTPSELEEVEASAKRQSGSGEEPDPSILEKVKRQSLLLKKQRALQAFQAAMRQQVKVETHEELL